MYANPTSAVCKPYIIFTQTHSMRIIAFNVIIISLP